MKRRDLLEKLRDEGKLELVEPSEEMRTSYIAKAESSLRSARILLEHRQLEDSITLSYYAMYNALTALLFSVGIKCENHTASIRLLGEVAGRHDLASIISFAKKERIDKQYYVTSPETLKMMAASAKGMAEKAEQVLVQMKLLLQTLSNDQRDAFRKKFALLLKGKC